MVPAAAVVATTTAFFSTTATTTTSRTTASTATTTLFSPFSSSSFSSSSWRNPPPPPRPGSLLVAGTSRFHLAPTYSTCPTPCRTPPLNTRTQLAADNSQPEPEHRRRRRRRSLLLHTRGGSDPNSSSSSTTTTTTATTTTTTTPTTTTTAATWPLLSSLSSLFSSSSNPVMSFSSLVVSLCHTVAPWAAMVVFLAPLPTIQKIRRVQSTGSLPLLPYTSMTASAFLWTVYGILRQEPSIVSCNVGGIVLGLYYFTQFVRTYSSNHNKNETTTTTSTSSSSTLPGRLDQHVQGIAAVVLLTSWLITAKHWLPSSLSVQDPAAWIGRGGIAMAIAMFASPLSALKVVWDTKSAHSIPWPFTIASLVNCLAWTITGLYRMKDFNVYFPNILGLTCALAQVALKFAFPGTPNKQQQQQPLQQAATVPSPKKTYDLPL